MWLKWNHHDWWDLAFEAICILFLSPTLRASTALFVYPLDSAKQNARLPKMDLPALGVGQSILFLDILHMFWTRRITNLVLTSTQCYSWVFQETSIVMQNATVNPFCRLVSSIATTDCNGQLWALLPIAIVCLSHDTAVITHILQVLELACFSRHTQGLTVPHV